MTASASPARRPWLRALLALPWLVLLAWTLWLASGVWDAQKLADAAWIASRVDAVDARRAELRHEPVTLVPDPLDGSPRVWVFGSSSVAAPSHEAFSRPLVRHLEERGRSVALDNLGWEGMVSWDVRARLDDAWALADERGVRPDLIVLYYGHNDVTYTWHFALELPHFDAVMSLTWLLSEDGLRGPQDDGNTYWLFGHRRAGPILKQLQVAGLLALDPAAFEPLRQRTLRVFEQVTRDFLAASRGVPVVIVPTVGNLRAEPWGPLQTATALWEQGMATQDPAAALQLLRRARDAETFTPDMRAKSDMLAMLRSLGPLTKEGPAPVTVCDLEGRLERAGARFGEDLFEDPVHFNDHGFDLMTGVIADCLVEGPLAPPAAEPSEPVP